MTLFQDSGVRDGKETGLVSGGGLMGFRPSGLRTPFGFLSQPVFAPEDGTGAPETGNEGGEPPASQTKTKIKLPVSEDAKAREAAEKAGREAADARAALESAEAARKAAEERLANFDGATPEEIKELRDLKRRAAEAEKKAAEESKKAEEEKLRAAGDFEALKARMAEEHAKELEAVKAAADEARKNAQTLADQIANMALSTAFANSVFIAKDTVLTASMARKIFADHFEVENGEVVAYDAPRGAQKRVKMVDARGNTMVFDEAMKRIVEGSNEKDSILRSQMKPGSGVKPGGVQPERKEPLLKGLDRIKAGIGALVK